MQWVFFLLLLKTLHLPLYNDHSQQSRFSQWGDHDYCYIAFVGFKTRGFAILALKESSYRQHQVDLLIVKHKV